MPIPASTANAALSIVSGLVRLTGRVDRIMAEQTALREDLALPSKVVTRPPFAIDMIENLQAFHDETVNTVPDPLGASRADLISLLKDPEPAEDKLVGFMEELLPDKLVFKIDDPAGDFANKLANKRAAWDLDDEDIRQVAYYLGPGQDLREAKLPWQLAMSVVDVIAEVALANQSLILRDDRARPILVAVLERFSAADLAEVGSHRVFLRIVLKATVNGALDFPDALDSDKIWVNVVLSALATARGKPPAGDDFVVGLLQGRGYPLLLGSLLQEGAGFLSDSDASGFELVASDVLTTAGKLVEQNPDFKRFFQDHWGDMLRAGLGSLHANGNTILKGAKPLLRETLLASLKVLSTTDNRDFLSSDTLTAALEGAIAAVALNPKLLDGVEKVWLREVLESTAGVIGDAGIRKTFSSAGVHTLMQSALQSFAEQPELLIIRPGLARDVVGSILGALAAAETPRLETVASAGVQAVLNALANDPDLVETRYPAIVAEVAGTLAVALEDLRLTRGEAGDILTNVATTIAADPTLVGLDQDSLSANVLTAVFGELAEHRGDLLTSTAIREVVGAVLEVVSADPGLLVDQPELVREAVAPMLKELSEVISNSAERNDSVFSQIATAGVQGVLSAIVDDPALLDTDYPEAVSKVAGALATNLADGKLNSSEVEEILGLAAEIIATNPSLLVKDDNELAAKALKAVLEIILAEDTIRIRRFDLAYLLGEVLAVLAAHGKGLLGDESADKLVMRITVVINAGLEKSARELGRLLDRSAVPMVLTSLLRRWALDGVETLDINDPRFERVFAGIVNDVLDRAG